MALVALSQFTVRFFADGFVERYGPEKVTYWSVITLGIGVSLVSFAPNTLVALAGFSLMGAGTPLIFPLAISEAAQRKDRSAAVNVAALAQLSFVVFLLAPPLLGLVAEFFGICVSFGIGLPLVVLSWFMVRSLRPNARSVVGQCHGQVQANKKSGHQKRWPLGKICTKIVLFKQVGPKQPWANSLPLL